MAMKRKAYSGYSGTLRFKRRRIGYKPRFKRRKYGNARKSSSWTIQTSSGKGLRPVSRKIRPRAWRKMLWRDTQSNIHWKSAMAVGSTSQTGATIANAFPVARLPTFGSATAPDATNCFWVAAGGARVKDVGSVLPHFEEGNMVVRGGQVGITFNVPDTVTQEIVVRLWVMWTNRNPTFAFVIGASIPYGMQLTSLPDCEQEVGKVIDYKEAYINGGHPVFSYVRRMGVQKIDTVRHAAALGSQIAFVFQVINMTDTTDVTVNHVMWHDLSFTADADN